MKKRLLFMMVAVAAVFALTACMSSQEKETAGAEIPATEESPVVTVSPEEPQEQETVSAEDVSALYSAQLERYYVALTEQWDEGRYYENEMSALAAYYYEGDPLENVGYFFVDMDNDGDQELIIGAIANTQQDPAVFEIWTLVNGEPVMLAQSGFRNRYFVEHSQEDGYWGIANDGSNSAASFALHRYFLEGDTMKVMQAIVFDAESDPENPWFMAYDDDWDTGNDTPIDESTATSIMDSCAAAYHVPAYIPYSMYKQG